MLKFLNKNIIYFIKNKQGITAPIFAIIALTATVATTTAINITAYKADTRALQALADQATKSSIALQNSETDITRRLEICEKTFTEGLKNNSVLSKSVTLKEFRCQENNQGTRVGLRADVKITPPTFKSIGVTGFDETILSSASMNALRHEVVLAVSTSGSMCAENIAQQKTDGTNYLSMIPDPECKKLEAAKKSIKRLMVEIEGMDNLKIGIVPYTYKVRFPERKNTPLSLDKDIPPSLQHTSEDKEFYTNFDKEPELTALTPLKVLDRHNKDELSKEFSEKLTASTSTPAWARTDVAMHVAGLMLDPKSTEYFSGHFNHINGTYEDRSTYSVGEFPKKENPDEKLTDKTIILLTDGANLGGAYTNHPSGNFENQYLYNYQPYQTHTLEACKRLKEKKVRIFTILLNVPQNTAGADVVEDLMTRCASGDVSDIKDQDTYLTCDKNPNCYRVDNAENNQKKLEEVFTDIGRRMKEVQLRR